MRMEILFVTGRKLSSITVDLPLIGVRRGKSVADMTKPSHAYVS